MGGKTWSRQEEAQFWRVIIPQSPKAAREEDRLYTWEECVEKMQRAMGKEARRKYTALMLFEHYFQNFCTRHYSPQARKFVTEHGRQVDAEADAAAALGAIAATPASKSRVRPEGHVRDTRRKKRIIRASCSHKWPPPSIEPAEATTVPLAGSTDSSASSVNSVETSVCSIKSAETKASSVEVSENDAPPTDTAHCTASVNEPSKTPAYRHSLRQQVEGWPERRFYLPVV